MEDLLVVDELETRIESRAGSVAAVVDTSLRVAQGEAVALVGESGCGKTLTALSVTRLVRPPVRIAGGRILFKGRDLLRVTEAEMRVVRGRQIGMIFQDPMTFLNPLMRVGAQVAETIRAHRPVSRAQANADALDQITRVRLPAAEQLIRAFPHQLSGGMRQRVLIAIAMCCEPDLIIADEPTTALDVTIQAQIMRLLADVRRDLGSALLLITHDLGLVAEHCDRVYVMYAGQIVEEGSVFRVFSAPMHPYTRALLASVLSPDRPPDRLEPIPGQPPTVTDVPRGCRFHPRCPEVMDRCRLDPPPVVTGEDGGRARCWLHDASGAR